MTAALFTIPHCQPLAGVCDTLNVVCDSTHCDTLHACAPETALDRAEIWWWARWAPAPRLLRTKSIAGREGQPDTLDLPSNEAATVYLILIDQSGNRSCQSNWITINTVASVEDIEPPSVSWFDLMGRRYFTKPQHPGIYWEVRRRGTRISSKKVIVLQ